VTELFHSLQGETRNVGIPTTFVRLTGCPLRCHYCDTSYAFHGGRLMTLSAILEEVLEFGSPHVTVTGGEPLAQPQCRSLLRQLCDHGHQVGLETSGALSVAGVDRRVEVVLDIKTPGSGEQDRNVHANFALLRRQDQVKFVICDRRDYLWARAFLKQHSKSLNKAGEILFSPSHDQLRPALLAQWILDDRLPVRMQLQLHKLLWGDAPGH